MWKRLLFVACLAGVASLAIASDLHEHLYPDALSARLGGSGPWGPLVFVVLFSALEAFGAPGILFMATAIAVWPPWPAFLLNWCGAVGAGLVGFGFARWIGRDWVAQRLPGRLAGLDARIAGRGLATVIVVRLLFFLAPPAHWALGLSRVGFGPFLLGSVLGFAPGIALVSFGGSALYAWLEGRSGWVWLSVFGLGLLIFAISRRLSAPRVRLQSRARERFASREEVS